jgi:hypothetical protein
MNPFLLFTCLKAKLIYFPAASGAPRFVCFVCGFECVVSPIPAVPGFRFGVRF